MNLRMIFNKAIILSVFAIAGYLLARSLYYGSLVGSILALVAIAAWALFLYKLSAAQEKDQQELSRDY